MILAIVNFYWLMERHHFFLIIYRLYAFAVILNKKQYLYLKTYKFMAKSKQTPIQRINRIQKFNLERGNNKESINNLQRKILMLKFNLW